jgi:uncharacterized protein (DUF433 family)
MNERIVVDPKICHGKPVIRGTRMPVALVVGSLAGGMSFEEVQREYDLSIDDIRAALKFAGKLIEQEQYHPLPLFVARPETSRGDRRQSWGLY